MKIKRGSTSVRRLIFIGDTSKTDGSGLASLAHNSSGLVAYYFAGDLSNDVQITLATATLGTWTSGGFIAVDNTNMPGWYEIGIPDAALDGGNEVAIQLRGATNMAPVNVYISLDAVDYQDAAGFGLSRIDAAILSRMASYTQPTGFLAATFPATVSSYAGGAVASVTGAVGSVTGAVTVGTNNDKTGYSLTVTPPTAATIADAVWDEIMSTHTINGSYGSHVVRSANQNQNTVTITGSQHVAADVHAFQAAVIDSAAFAANWLTAAGTAADYITELQTAIGTAAAQTTAQSDLDDIQSRLPAALVAGRMDASVGVMQADTVTSAALAASAVTEIQAGLATSANQTLILDRQGFALAVLAGTISDAQTAAETYAITISGSTFTVDFAGLDASGNRSGQTLVKT